MADDNGAQLTSIGYDRRTILKSGATLGALSMIPTAAGKRSETEIPEPPTGTGARLYVSPDGNDSWNGKAPDRRGCGNAGPLGTLEGARDRIRELKQEEGLPDGGVTVYLRGGEYARLESSFELTAADSGTEESPIVYRAYEDEDVRILGGTELNSEQFQPVSDSEIKERLPEASRDEVVEYDLAADGIDEYGEIVTSGFNLPRSPPDPELFVNGESMTLARWPNDGWIDVGEVHDPGARPRDIKETFTERPLPDAFDEGATFEYTNDRPETWADYDDVWMDGYWWNNYAMSNLRIEEFNQKTGTITTDQAHHYSVRSQGRYYYYNVLDELDVPGEFYIDRDEGMLYVYSPSSVTEATIQLSLLADPIVSMDGASHVVFRDVEFGISRGSGVKIEGCSNCRVQDCTVHKVGIMGVVIGSNPTEKTAGNNGGTDNGVVDCEIYDTGMGGVKLGGGDRMSLTPGNNYAVDNEVHDFSRIQSTYTPAVWPTGVGNRIAHNHIHHAPHQALLIGGNEHIIEYNDVHHVVQDTTDSGAIYMGRDWSEHGNEIRHNYLHHIKNDIGDGFGQFAVYLDDLQSGTVMQGNVIYRVGTAFSIGGGRHNRLRNNLIIDCGASIEFGDRALDEPDWPHCRTEEQGGSGVMIDRLKAMPYDEEPWASTYPKLVTLLDDQPCAPKYNTITCNLIVGSPEMEIGDAVAEYGTVGDNFHTDEDVSFVDESQQNFRLESDAAVLEEVPCFENVPFDEMATDDTYPDYSFDASDVLVHVVDEQRHEIDVTIHNEGREEAPSANVVVDNLLTGITIGETATEAIPPTESTTLTVSWDASNLPVGSEQELRIRVDPDDEIPELTTSNNVVTFTTTVLAEVGDEYSTFANTEAYFGRTGGSGLVINANGEDVWEPIDEYGAVYKSDSVESTSTITTKVRSVEDTGPLSKAGIMVRNDISAPSESAGYVTVLATPDRFQMLGDDNGDGYLESWAGDGTTFQYPVWLKLERDGTTFTGYRSSDGSNWTELDSMEIDSVDEVQDAGVYVSATAEELHLAEFAEFTTKE